MKNISALLLCALAMGAPVPSLRAQEAPPLKGRVLILVENEKTLTGDIDQVGDEYRVKRLVGETRVPAASVLKLCASFEDAYRFMQGRANLHDPDERVRLADWCRQHNLRDQALVEVRAALALRPTDARARHLLTYLENARTQAEQPRPVVAPERPTPRVDVTAESLGLFASKVQPILMNACVSCHNSGRGGGFQLTRTTGGLTNRRSLEQNLAAVVAEINPNEASASRLLLKAISLHAPGMTQAPLKGRMAPAYRTLETWVKTTLETNPQLKEQAVAAASTPPARWGDERTPPAAAAPAKTETPAPSSPVPVPVPLPVPAAAKPEAKPQAGPADPDAFNREFHPERQPPTTTAPVPPSSPRLN